MPTTQDISVEVRRMTTKCVSTLRSIMSIDDIDLLNVRLHLPKTNESYDLVWPICFKKKKGYCVNGFAYGDVQSNFCILRVKEYIPVKWTEKMEYDLLKSVEKEVKSKGIELPVALLVGSLTVHAIV